MSLSSSSYQDRGGLGRKKFLHERLAQKKAEEARSVRDFRRRKQDGFSKRRVEMDLQRSQQACEHLDLKMVCMGGLSSKREWRMIR